MAMSMWNPMRSNPLASDFWDMTPSDLFDQDFGAMMPFGGMGAGRMGNFGGMGMPYWMMPSRTTGLSGERAHSSVINDNEKFAVTMDVRQFKPEEIKVKMINDMVEVEGRHEEKLDEHGSISRHFVRKYKLPKDVDPTTIQSNLTRDGMLTVMAPKKAIKSSNERMIPITMGGSVPTKSVTGTGSEAAPQNLVSLLGLSRLDDIAQEAMEALLCLHQVENIQYWNAESPWTAMQTFWCIGSQLLYSVCQKLLHHELVNYPSVLCWLRQLLNYRNVYLMNNREIANFGSTEPICKQAAAKFETVCFIYLWSLESDAVLAALSLFRCLCDEAEIRCALDDMPQDYEVHAELAGATNLQTAGRAALQKSICRNLRRFKRCTEASERAWEDTFRHWERFTEYLASYPGSKTDDRLQVVEQLCNVLTQPRRRMMSVQDHEFEDIINCWANMTGFLCSMGVVFDVGARAQSKNVASSPPANMDVAARGDGPDQYCSVSQFMHSLFSLLRQADSIEPAVIRHVKEILSHELNPMLYAVAFEQIKTFTDQFFDASGYVILSRANSDFLEHVVYVMRNILQSDPTKIGHSKSVFSSICIEPILVSICRYVRFTESNARNLAVRSKICYLIEIVIQRRCHLLIHSEIRFRNRLIDYLTDWLLMSHPSSAISSCAPDLIEAYRDLDMACMKAANVVLIALPLQADQSEHDMLEAKSRVFQRIFHTFMTVLNDCANESYRSNNFCCALVAGDHVKAALQCTQSSYGVCADAESSSGWTSDGELNTRSMAELSTISNDTPSHHGTHHNSAKCRASTEQQIKKLRRVTVHAMTTMLAANIDVGLAHALGLGYHRDLHMRGAFIEVLTRILLQQGMQFNTLNETAMVNRYQELVKLITMITDDGDLPIALALASVVHAQQLDELARILVTVFDARHLLYELNWKIFSKEVEAADAPTTLFRGNTLASKLMGFCFRLYGSTYLRNTLQPVIDYVMRTPDRCYELEPSRLETGSNLEDNVQNVLNLVQMAFDQIVISHERFPTQLRTMCHCLHEVVNWRFPQSGLNSIEMIIFLRFINPALVSPYEYGLIDTPPPLRVRRGLMIASKILQAIANRASFIKEPYLTAFSEFIQNRMEPARIFVSQLTSCDAEQSSSCRPSHSDDAPQQATLKTLAINQQEEHSESIDSQDIQSSTDSLPFIGENQLLALHHVLWSCQDAITQYFASSPAYTHLSRRLLTLLAQIGPPPTRVNFESGSADTVGLTGDFESTMAAKNMSGRDEYRHVQESNVFFQAGVSRQGNPVFYYIARRYKTDDMDDQALLYHILVQLRTKADRKFELVIDLTHVANENRFKNDALQRMMAHIPTRVANALDACYVVNVNSFMRDYINLHQRILNVFKNNRKLVFLDNVSKLNDYITGEQQRLPTESLSFNQDIHLFNNVVRVMNRDQRCIVKVSQSGLQISYIDRQKVLGFNVVLNDVFFASELEEEVIRVENKIEIKIREKNTPLTLQHRDAERLQRALTQLVNRHEFTQSHQQGQHAKLRAKDVPGTLLNIALLNLGSGDPSLRSLAYNLLCALAGTFDFMIDDQLFAAEGLLIPSNDTAFVVSMSERIALNKPHLTLEFLEQCLQSFEQPSTERHVCLEYLSPWLQNLPKLLQQSDAGLRREKIVQIIDSLISLTIDELDMYPLILRFVWQPIGGHQELLEITLDSLVKRAVDSGGLASAAYDVVTETAVALATENKSAITALVVNRFITVLEKTCSSPRANLSDHPLWPEIAVLARVLLVLSFNNALDVSNHLPSLFHFICVLLCVGPLSLRAAMHGLIVNLIHSLCVSATPAFSDATKRVLKLALTELSLPKFYVLFGISQITPRTVASAALRPMHMRPPTHGRPLAAKARQQSTSLASMNTIGGGTSPHMGSTPTHRSYYQGAGGLKEGDTNAHVMNASTEFCLSDLKTLTDTLKEVVECVQRELPLRRDLVTEWAKLARCFAFRYNQALQPRALVVFGCLTKQADENDLKQTLTLLVQAIKRREEPTLISALLMSLTNLLVTLPVLSTIPHVLFWVCVIVFQLEEAMLYSDALSLLDACLRTLDQHNAFDNESLEKMMMDFRRPLEWEFKALDQHVGLSFRHNFNFALVGYLLKALRHPHYATRQLTVRLLHLLLSISAKPMKRNRYDVTLDNLPYLTALLPYADDVRRRCHLRSFTRTPMSTGGSVDTVVASVSAGSTVRTSYGDNTVTTAAAATEGSPWPSADTIDRLRRIELAANHTSTQPHKQTWVNRQGRTSPRIGVQVPRFADRLTGWAIKQQQQQSGHHRHRGAASNQRHRRSARTDLVLTRSSTVQIDDQDLTATAFNRDDGDVFVETDATVGQQTSNNNTTSIRDAVRSLSLPNSPTTTDPNNAFELNSNMQQQINGQGQDAAASSSTNAAGVPRIAVLDDSTVPTASSIPLQSTTSGNQQLAVNQQRASSLTGHPSISEANILLDPEVLCRSDSQALMITLLATMIRNSTEEHETRILFQYLAEASDLFPKVFSIVQPLLDARITQLLLACHDPSLLSNVLHIVENLQPSTPSSTATSLLPDRQGGMSSGDNATSTAVHPGSSVRVRVSRSRAHSNYLVHSGPSSTTASLELSVTAMHTIGFGGLWRFAGPFLTKTASQQAITAEVCACLERLIGNLGELPPMTPPPRLPPSPVFVDFPAPTLHSPH